MNFPFPNIKEKCLVCGTSCGARWKGYYVRQIVHDLYIGPVAIHVGHCFRNKQDFSYVPDFIIPGRKLSRPSFLYFLKTYYRTKKIKTSIDSLLINLGDDKDFHIPISTAYDWVYQSVRSLRINAAQFAIAVPIKNAVFSFLIISPSVVESLFLIQSRWHPFHQIIIQPP